MKKIVFGLFAALVLVLAPVFVLAGCGSNSKIGVAKKKYKVTFVGTSTSSSVSLVRSGKRVNQPNIPTKAGYKFDAWYTSENGTEVYDFYKPVKSNLTLYARFYDGNISMDDGGIERGARVYSCSKTATYVAIPSIFHGRTVTDIDFEAFKNSKLQVITIPDSVTTISGNAFYNCKDLISITFGKGVTTIESCAFYNCKSLNNLIIPKTVTQIGEAAFFGCESLENIIVASQNTKYDSREGCNTIVETATNKIIVGCKNTSFPSSVRAINEFAFGGCGKMTEIEIPTTITEIGYKAFCNCDSLESITIPFVGSGNCRGTSWLAPNIWESVKNMFSVILGRYGAAQFVNDQIYIPDSLKNVTILGGTVAVHAFYGLSGIENVTMQNGVTSIGAGAFFGCTDLKSIVIPQTVTTIGEDAICGCHNLQSITIHGNFVIPDYETPFLEVLMGHQSLEFDKDLDTITFLGDKLISCARINMKHVVCAGNPTEIPAGCFSNCASLEDFEIPETVTQIGEDAFWGCISLESVEIPETVEIIGANAFYSCSSLCSINLPNSLETIEDGLFWGCSSLAEIEIPNTVVSIGFLPFYGTAITNINIPNSVKSIGGFSFAGMASLESIVIPASVESVGAALFSNCTSLERLVIDCKCLYDVITEFDSADYGVSLDDNTVVYVKQSIDDGTNWYLTYSYTRTNGEGDYADYYVYTKNQ